MCTKYAQYVYFFIKIAIIYRFGVFSLYNISTYGFGQVPSSIPSRPGCFDVRPRLVYVCGCLVLYFFRVYSISTVRIEGITFGITSRLACIAFRPSSCGSLATRGIGPSARMVSRLQVMVCLRHCILYRPVCITSRLPGIS
jgi:hypothetical protein